MTVPFADLAGAVTDERGLVHLGNPFGEQRALAEGLAAAPLGDRRVLAVTGEDRLSWLDSLTSQSLAHLAPGIGTELLVLDPQGRVEHAAAVLDDGLTTWLIVDDDHVEGLLAWLLRMRFRLRVVPRDASSEFVILGGTLEAVRVLPAAAPEGVALVWRDPWPEVSVGGWGYAAGDGHPGTDRDWAEALVPVERLAELESAAASGSLRIAGRLAAEALRIAAWRPRAATEVDERTIPHEVDWLRTAVHLSKGCYRGQETVAKVHNLGHPPRRLVGLQLDGSEATLPVRGDVVLADGVEVGAVTAAARHYEQGPIALAIIKRAVAPDAELTVRTSDGEVAAAQEVIVPTDAGSAASVPRLPRLSRRTR